MNVGIVNTLTVPSGAASVNRILSYSKGLVELGDKVTILSSGLAAEQKEGEVDGIQYKCFRQNKSNLVLKIGEFFATLLRIVRYIIRSDFNVIILVSNSLLLIYPIVIVGRFKGIKVIQEKSEFPFSLMKKKLFNRLFSKFYISTTYKLFDGLIVMTKPLMVYFKDKVSKKCQMVEIPMTVDLDRFNNPFVDSSAANHLGDYVAYCGDMAGNKDGVENLINAFGLVTDDLPDLKLVLIGGSSNEHDFEVIESLVTRLNLKNVLFYGKAARTDIPALLLGAKALLLARPSSLQSFGGFPTKLGEYLSTGNPVIVTAVGDIPLYLNESNSYIVAPDDNEAFANKILEVFADYNKALIIGQEGKKLADTVFSFRVQSKRIHNYLKQF